MSVDGGADEPVIEEELGDEISDVFEACLPACRSGSQAQRPGPAASSHVNSHRARCFFL